MRDYAPDPEAFRPERFLEAKVRDPNEYVFGFGRRYVTLTSETAGYESSLTSICPGRYMVDNSLFLAISGILQVFSIGKALNEDGSEKLLEPRWETGMTVYANSLSFFTVICRSDERV
jgi:hypothetical protein